MSPGGDSSCPSCGSVSAVGAGTASRPRAEGSGGPARALRAILVDAPAGEASEAVDAARDALGRLGAPPVSRPKTPRSDRAVRRAAFGKQAPPAGSRPAPPGPRSLREHLGGIPAWAVSGVLHVAGLLLLTFLVVNVGPPPAIHVDLSFSAPPVPPLPLPDLPQPGDTSALDRLAESPPLPEVPVGLLEDRPETPDDRDFRESLVEKTPLLAPGAEKYGWRGRGGRRLAAARGGGTYGSEKAVAAGLRWLAGHQDAEGWWGYFEETFTCGKGSPQQRTGLTGLALLAFLGAGQTAETGGFAPTVARGLRWLASTQEPEGGFPGNLYHDAIAALALAEAAGMGTGGEPVAKAAARAAGFLVSAQNKDGGWRYEPRSGESDTSVTGWCLMALSAARAAGFPPEARVLERARRFLDSMTTPEGETGYTSPEGGINALTAVGLLGRSLTGATPQDPLVRRAAGHVSSEPAVWDLEPARREGKTFLKENPINLYRWYYTSLALYPLGGPEWERWNPNCRDVLVRNQRRGGGCADGSWDPVDVWSGAGGRVYSTATAVLTLEVYYRAAPRFLEVPDDELAALPVGTAFHGELLWERARAAAAAARRAAGGTPSERTAAAAAAEGALGRFREWARRHLDRPGADGAEEVAGWLALAEREEGEAALLRGDRARAEEILRPVLDRAPDGPAAPGLRRLLAKLALEGADQRRAADLLAEILRRGEEPDPAGRSTIWRTLGDLRARLGDPGGAAAAYRSAVAGAAPEEAEALRRRLASALLQLRDWRGALEALGLVAGGAPGSLAPKEAEAAISLAVSLAERMRADGDAGAGADLLDQAVERFGPVASPAALAGLRRARAEALGAAGRHEEAADVWLALAASGAGPAAELRAAAALIGAGKAVVARDLTAKLQGSLAPFSDPWWEARCLHAEALLAVGDRARARALVENTQALYPQLGGEALRGRFLRVLEAAGR